MSIDLNQFPIAPTTLLAGVAYLAFMAVVGGPGIASREIAKSGWHSRCEAQLIADLEASRASPAVIPETPDVCRMVGGMVGGIFSNMPELGELCTLVPDPNVRLAEAERRRQADEDARIRRAAERTNDACSCAVASYQASHRWELAGYAATARLYTPSAVSERETALARALRSPSCRSGKV